MIKPKKKFGQNFLIDISVINNIINSIAPKHQDKILEIGPGMGALTFEILKHTNSIDVIEIDKDMINFLEKRNQDNKIRLINKNILDIENVFFAEYTKIIGNLPYYISSEILIKITKNPNQKTSYYFMLQKEVADRISSPEGNSNFGRISAFLQYFFKIDLLFDVGPDSFEPPPKIRSSIVKLEPLKRSNLKVFSHDAYELLLRQSFKQKRKKIKNNLKNILTSDDFSNCNINPELRPECLSVEDYINIENYIFQKKIPLN
jgi:16S rRNA (adenine1518-N6/adenine1519-N6)-dimethyltransferase